MLAKAIGALYPLSMIAAGVYAVPAVMLGWPPADRVCALEALLDGHGGYDAIEAWAVTWFHLLAVLAAPPVLFGLVQVLRRRSSAPRLEGAAAERSRRLASRRLALGLAGTALVSTLYALVLASPATLAANALVAILARLGLILGPFASFFAPAAVLDALLAPTSETVIVTTLTDGKGPEQKLLNGLFEVDARLAAELRVGSEVKVISTRVFRSVLSLTELGVYR